MEATQQFFFANPNAGHIQCGNMLNAGLFLVNLGVMTFAALEVFGDPIEILFEKFSTLITPGEPVLRIFPVVFIFEGVFVLAQLTPRYRNHFLIPLMTPIYTAKSLFQIQWVIELIQGEPGNIAYSMILVFGMLGSLLGMILVIDARRLTFFEYWLLRAPFSVQAGWFLFCSILNVNMWATSVEPKLGNSMLFAIAMLSLAAIFVITALFGINTRRPDPMLVYPVVWSMFWAWRNSDRVPPKLPQQMLTSADIACAHVYTGVLCLAVFATVMRLQMVWVANKKLQDAIKDGDYQGGGSLLLEDNTVQAPPAIRDESELEGARRV